MGRGHPYQSWHGNIRLAALVEEYTESYMQLKHRSQKTKMASTIVTRVLEEEEEEIRGRFIQRTDWGWEPPTTESWPNGARSANC